jgi:hypothetical protein
MEVRLTKAERRVGGDPANTRGAAASTLLTDVAERLGDDVLEDVPEALGLEAAEGGTWWRG